MRIRRPVPTGDCDDALALIQACDRAVCGDSDWTAAELREEWGGLDLDGDAWVADEEGRLAGLMHLHAAGTARLLADGYVHPDLTGRGAGSRLLAAAEERALDHIGVWDGDELAAASVNYAKRLDDWGFVATLGFRPPWRRRGLGLALLHESFRRFANRGETTAALGVDSENLTGATRLYERAGMRVLWRADVWRKELRPGG